MWRYFILCVFLVSSCGLFSKTEKRAKEPRPSVDPLLVEGYWQLVHIRINGKTGIDGKEFTESTDRRLYILQDGRFSEFNITRKAYSDPGCLKDAPYRVEGSRIVLPEKPDGDKICATWTYIVDSVTSEMLVIRGLFSSDGEHAVAALNEYQKISAAAAQELMNPL